MKKVLLMVALGASMVALTSCFGRDCVCKTVIEKDGDKVSKSKEIYYDLADGDKDKCKDNDSETSLGGNKVVVKCH